MAFETYKEVFEKDMRDEVEAPGDFSRKVDLVRIYTGLAPGLRPLEFQNWLLRTKSFCERCGKKFTPRPRDVDEENEIVCPQHK